MMITEKRCSKCKEVKAAGKFGRQASAKTGLHSHCKECRAISARKAYATDLHVRERVKASVARWRVRHPEYRPVRTLKQREADLARRRLRRQQDPSYRARSDERVRRWNQENPERRKELVRASYRRRIVTAEGRAKKKSWGANRRAAKRSKDIPGWTKELKEVYANCPKGYHVDHIYPLQPKKGEDVGRGYHVPWNLQYLTAAQNSAKRNKFPSEAEIALYLKQLRQYLPKIWEIAEGA